MKENGRFKKKRVYFSQVSNNALRDKALSLKAKGLYALIQSYITIENFILYKNTLKKACKEGTTSFEATWKELKDMGYLVQEKHKRENGTFYYEYELLDVSNHTPKTGGVDNLPYGKPGAYNSTDVTNTDLNNTEKFNGFPERKSEKQIVSFYLRYYQHILGKKHPKVAKEKQIEVLDRLYYFGTENETEYEDWQVMIEHHFSRNMETDYNICHFATPGVLQNIWYEAIYRV